MLEPGLDKHLWESWWQQFDEDVQTSPGEALPELDGLIAQMLEARGYAIDDPVVRLEAKAIRAGEVCVRTIG